VGPVWGGRGPERDRGGIFDSGCWILTAACTEVRLDPGRSLDRPGPGEFRRWIAPRGRVPIGDRGGCGGGRGQARLGTVVVPTGDEGGPNRDVDGGPGTRHGSVRSVWCPKTRWRNEQETVFDKG
jgi:hypothetical protein